MANAMLDARHEDGAYRRVEVITGHRRRRRWTAEEKAEIVAESFEGGANISDVARRHGVARGLLTVWRRQAAEAMSDAPRGFVPVRISSAAAAEMIGESGNAAGAKAASLAPAACTAGATIEIELCGARIRVGTGVDATTLTTVLIVVRSSTP
jgi:transposase